MISKWLPLCSPLLLLNTVLTARAAIRQAFTLSLKSLDVVRGGEEEEDRRADVFACRLPLLLCRQGQDVRAHAKVCINV